MEVLPLSPQSVTVVNRQNSGGVQAFAQAAPPAPDPASSAPREPSVTAAKDVPSSSQVAQAVRQVNDAFAQRGLNLYASFEKDKISGITIVKIVEKKSNDVIHQLPPKEMVAFAQSLDLPEGWRGQWIRNMT